MLYKSSKNSSSRISVKKSEPSVKSVLKEYVKKGTKIDEDMIEEFTDGKGKDEEK